MGACTTVIFAALLEFTLTNYLWRKGHKGRSLQAAEAGSLADGIGVAVAAATGAGTISGFDPVISSAAVAGAATAAEHRRTVVDNGQRAHPVMVDEFQMANRQMSEDEQQQLKLFGGLSEAEMNGNFATSAIDTVSKLNHRRTTFKPRQ